VPDPAPAQPVLHKAAALTGTPTAAGAVAPISPSPADQVSTGYGAIGKWMLMWDRRIANWGGKRYEGKTLLESVNVIIVDPNSSSRAQAVRALNKAMYFGGFAAQPFHSNGYQGRIDDVVYGQQPRGPLQSYSNDLFLLPNDHGRIFGPDPLESSAGYVWSGAFSTEKFGFSGGTPGHFYVSSNGARDSLAQALINSGRATYGGVVAMENAFNTDGVTTGDHDGFAVVLILTGNVAPVRRDPAGIGPSSTDVVQAATCAAVSGGGQAATLPDQSVGPLTDCVFRAADRADATVNA
jgi:hypothetical protein